MILSNIIFLEKNYLLDNHLDNNLINLILYFVFIFQNIFLLCKKFKDPGSFWLCKRVSDFAKQNIFSLCKKFKDPGFFGFRVFFTLQNKFGLC